MNIEEALLSRLLEQQREIERSCCEFPADDYASYLQRVGEWVGLKKSIDELLALKDDDN